MPRLAPLTAALAAALVASPARAVPADPVIADEVAALNAAAKRAVGRGDYAAALTAYRTAAQRMRGDPQAAGDRATALYLAGVCLERLNRVEEALSAHREALALGPPAALVDRVHERVEALEAILRDAAAAGVSPAEAALLRINEAAKDAVARKDYAAALSAYRDAAQRLRAFPDRRADLAVAEFLAGRCLEALGREAEAAETYRRARALGPPELQARVDERLASLAPKGKSTPPTPPTPVEVAPPPPTGVAVTLDCTPVDLVVTVPGALAGQPCEAVRTLPPGAWRLEGRRERQTVVRTVEVRGPGPQRFSLVLPPPLPPAAPPPAYRLAWGLAAGALVAVGTGVALRALDGDGLDAPAGEVGTGLLVTGGLLGAAAAWAFADPPLGEPPAVSGGVVGFSPTGL